MTHREKLLEISRGEIYRFSEEPFTLASGKKSNHYFNCKKITLIPERLRLLATSIRDEILPGNQIAIPQAAGGLTLGADPIAVALSLAFLENGRTVFPLIVRKEAKGHGTGQKIEGEWQNIKEVLVLDDVITTGGSTQKAVEAFRAAGIAVHTAVCIIDREEGGREALEKDGVRLLSLFKKTDFLSASGK